MKILFCPAHYALLNNRGSELRWAYQIVNSLGNKYSGSIAVTEFSNVKALKYKIISLHSKKKYIDLGLFNTIRFAFAYGVKGLNLLKKESFDIHHHVLPFYLGRTFNIAFLIPSRKRVIKIIGPVQNTLPYFPDNLHDQNEKLTYKKIITNKATNYLITLFSFPLKILSYATLKKSDAIIVVNDDVRNTLIRQGVSDKHIYVISPGVDTKKFYPKKITDSKHQKKIEVLSTGALISRKGYDLLIESIYSMKNKKGFSKLHLTIVGDGPQKATLKKLVKKRGLANKITFVGQVPFSKMPYYYRNADIFVSMTRADSVAQMYLEAMSSGLAIITSKNYGSRAIIENGKTGYLVDNENYLQLGEKLSQLINNKELREKLQLHAMKAAEEYDWENSIIPQYISLYNNLIYDKK
jgi:glycosyltransferase involved in cell wall biosynthesis